MQIKRKVSYLIKNNFTKVPICKSKYRNEIQPKIFKYIHYGENGQTTCEQTSDYMINREKKKKV